MRIILASLLCTLFVACASKRPETALTAVDIVEIKPRYMDHQSFVRIGEYLTGKEIKGDRVIMRSRPENRTGYYFTLVLDENVQKLPQGTTIKGEFFVPSSTQAQTFNFKLPPKRPNTNEVFIGLTGDDWPEDKNTVPAAWRFTIIGPNGNTLGTEKSFLWSI